MTGMAKVDRKLLDKLLDFAKTAPAHVVADLNGTVRETMSLVREIDQSKTRRAEIDAVRATAVADIDAKRAVLEMYLDRSFNERAEVLRGKLAAFDKALDASQPEVAIAALNAIVETIKTSPLSGGGEIRSLLESGKPMLLE